MPARRRRRPTREHAAASDDRRRPSNGSASRPTRRGSGRERRRGLPRRARGRRRLRRTAATDGSAEPSSSPPDAAPGPGVPTLEEDETLGLRARGRRQRRASSGCCAATAQAMAALVAALADDDAGRAATLAAPPDRASSRRSSPTRSRRRPSTSPTDHQFWGPFTRTQDRDIVHALSSLGYRFDGLGGWTDGPPTVAARPVAGARLRRASTRCGSATGRPRRRPRELFRDVDRRRRRVPGRGRRRPDPGRDGGDARTSRGRPGRGLERLGPDPAAAPRGAPDAGGSARVGLRPRRRR